jgi:hypothetical protein
MSNDFHPSLVGQKPAIEVQRNEASSLPPISDIVIPSFQTKSGTIRWLFGCGYAVKDISNYLGIKYQMVRNIVTNLPKRAAREDMAPLVIELKPEPDLLDAALDGALDASLMAGRKERNKKRLESLRENPDAEVVEEEQPVVVKSTLDILNRR